MIRDAASRIEKAKTWLLKNHAGAYFFPKLIQSELDTTWTDPRLQPSLEATAAVLHLFAWRARVDKTEADKRAARLLADVVAGRVDQILRRQQLPPDSFYAAAMAGRALMATAKAIDRADFWDLTILLAARLARSVPDDRDPGLRKAALIFRLTSRHFAYDDVDVRLYRGAPPDEVPETLESDGRPTAAMLQALGGLERSLFSVEALIMGQASAVRARAEFQTVQALARRLPVRSAVLQAQIVRLCMMGGVTPTPEALDRLIDLQHEDGGFYSWSTGTHQSQNLCVIGTAFAMQAMRICSAAPGQNIGGWPGPLESRDLAIV